jgi:hypothetical protein
MNIATDNIIDGKEAPGSTNRHFRCQRPPTTILDIFIDLILIIFVIGAWRATWNLWDLYLFNKDMYISSWIGFVICLLVVFLVAQNKWAAVV